MVCPICGSGEFEATLTTRTKYTYSFEKLSGGVAHYENASEVVDGGDIGDVDGFECSDCGELCQEDDLVGEDYYTHNREEADREHAELTYGLGWPD